MSIKNISETNIGSRIKEVRKKSGQSQTLFAASIEITQGFLSGLESGRYQPTAEILIRISNIYKMSPSWLLTGEENAIPKPQKKKTKVMELIEVMLEGMSEDALRDVLKYTEEKKLLTELLAGQKPRRTVNGG